MEDVTISFPYTDMTPIATPYNDGNGQSQMELDEELHLSPVKFYYSHEDPGQYSIGHTPDLNENVSPIQRAISSSLTEEENKLPVIPEGTTCEMARNLTDVKEEEEEQRENNETHSYINGTNVDLHKTEIETIVSEIKSEMESSRLEAKTEIELVTNQAKDEIQTVISLADEKMKVVSDEIQLATEESKLAVLNAKENAGKVESVLEKTKMDMNTMINDVSSLHSDTKLLAENIELTVNKNEKIESEVTLISTELKEFYSHSHSEIKTIIHEQRSIISTEVTEAKTIAKEAKSIAEKVDLESKSTKQLAESTSAQMVTSCEEIREEVDEAKKIAKEAKWIAEEAKLVLEEVRSASVAAEERSYCVLSEARSISVAAKAEALDLVEKITVIDSELDAAASVYSSSSNKK